MKLTAVRLLNDFDFRLSYVTYGQYKTLESSNFDNYNERANIISVKQFGYPSNLYL